ncbi:hypothetical protein ACU8KH_01352 [Lachancea thermotolerans]
MLRRMSHAIKFYDIGLNLTDPMYQGLYNGKQYHQPDIQRVLRRAQQARVHAMLLTGSSIHESQEAVALAARFHSPDARLYYTLGVHPCCVNEFVLADTNSTIDNPTNDPEFNARLDVADAAFTKSKLRQLYTLMRDNARDPKFRAIGEIGLDYDRFYYSSQKMQLLFFEEQLKLSCLFPEMPLFLHMRNCCADFVAVLDKFVRGFADADDRFDHRELVREAGASHEHLPQIRDDGAIFYRFSPVRKFVTHSFTGSPQDLQDVLSLSANSYIGMNGCSFKTAENIQCAKEVPLERLLLETDAPWCDIRRTHDSYKYLFTDPSAHNLQKDDPWHSGLSDAYPDIPQWFNSVKRDKLDKKSEEEREQTTVKSRNEPCFMGHVATVVARVKQLPIEEVASTVWDTTCGVYGE